MNLLKNRLLFLFYFFLLTFDLACSKDHVDLKSQVYGTWYFRSTQGTIATSEGHVIGVSQSWTTNNQFQVRFENSGDYYFTNPLKTENGKMQLLDSLMLLASDSSYFANMCFTFNLGFYSDTVVPGFIYLYPAVDSLHIEYLRTDSMRIRAQKTVKGINAPDTIYTQWTGFSKS